MIRAETHAEFAQRRARVLRETAHVFGDNRAIKHTQMFADLKGDAACHAFQTLTSFEIGKRAEMFLHMLREPQTEPALHRVEWRAGELLVGEHLRFRCKNMVACISQRSIRSAATSACRPKARTGRSTTGIKMERRFVTVAQIPGAHRTPLQRKANENPFASLFNALARHPQNPGRNTAPNGNWLGA